MVCITAPFPRQSICRPDRQADAGPAGKIRPRPYPVRGKWASIYRTPINHTALAYPAGIRTLDYKFVWDVQTPGIAQHEYRKLRLSRTVWLLA
jgi:hypothetical protein